MAYEGKKELITVTALEDLSANQHYAFANDDGKLANNGEEALGIIDNKPQSGEPASVAYAGVSKFKAGGAITRGGKLTVTTSGFIVAGDSGSYIVGEALETVSSGSIGTGVFNFPTASYLSI